MIDYEILQDIITDHELCKVQENELAKVVELLKSGRLIELPCAVGDTVWCIDSFNLDGTLRKQPIIREIEFNHHHLEFVGKTVFLTKEEAEAKLAE